MLPGSATAARRQRGGVDNETIYDLIPKKEEIVVKGERYESKFRGQVKEEVATSKRLSGWMGPPPEHLVKGQSTAAQRKEHSHLHHGGRDCDCGDHRRPPVPRRGEWASLKEKLEKNIIQENALRVIKSAAKKPEPMFVDTPGGARHPVKESGLVPNYVKKQTFGKVPEYLKRRQEGPEAGDAGNKSPRSSGENQDGAPHAEPDKGYVAVDEEERQKLLNGLKANWEDVYRQYQQMSLVVDTIPKRVRKENLEKQMAALERDIEILEKPRHLYVAPSRRDPYR